MTLCFALCCLGWGESIGQKLLSADQLMNSNMKGIVDKLPTVSKWIDEKSYLEMRRDGEGNPHYMKIDIKTGKESTYEVSKAVDPYVKVKDGDIYYLKAGVETKITSTPGEEKNPTLSPDGNFIAYTLDNDLYTYDIINGKVNRLTTDGSNVILNGYASWVIYEEILGRGSKYRAFWWSEDSQRIAFFRCDDSEVPMFPIYVANGQHGSIEETRYPKAGDKNPEVAIGIVSPNGGEIVWADFKAQDDQYFGAPFWIEGELWVQWMPREQNELIIYAINPINGSKRIIYKEQQETWVDWFDDIRFVNGGFVIRSDKSGWSNLYMLDMNGREKSRITDGEWTVKEIKHIDSKRGVVYFTARKENSTRFDLYSVNLDGTKLKRLTFGDYNHVVDMSPDGGYFITTYSNSTTPPRMALVNSDGKIIRELGDSKGGDFDQYVWANVEIVRVPSEDGLFELPVKITYPINFDPNKKYPALVKIYGGPDAGTVYDRWGLTQTQWWAQQEMFVLEFDHRGSGHFGKVGMNYLHRNLGKWEMIDYISLAKYFRAKPYIDVERFGIMGGSFGGTVTALALTDGAEYFTHGIAAFGVMDWSLYDSHYTERYMDRPVDNPEGYDFTRVLNRVGKYRGENRLFIIHGTTDDNVHLQNSIQLIEALQNDKKLFRMMFYPNCRHGWGGNQRIHWYAEEAEFIYENLLLKQFPATEFGVQ